MWWVCWQCAERILSFLKDQHTHVEGLGSVCSLSLFDLDKVGNPAYSGAPTPPLQPPPPTPATPAPGDQPSAAAALSSGQQPPLSAPRVHVGVGYLMYNQDGKVEKSLLNFKVRQARTDRSTPAAAAAAGAGLAG